jgi:hypothetical protein
MAMTNTDKNLAIARLEVSLQDAKEAAGVATLGEIETGIAALRTAYDADPTTATETMINDAAQQVRKLIFPSLDSARDVFTEAATEAAAAV